MFPSRVAGFKFKLFPLLVDNGRSYAAKATIVLFVFNLF